MNPNICPICECRYDYSKEDKCNCEKKNRLKQNHCQNDKCYNLSNKLDLSGNYCQDECFIESESGERVTRKELLEMKVDYDWEMDKFEIQQVQDMGIVKSAERLKNE